MKTNYQPRYRKSWALVIGINQYTHFSPLDIACNDAKSIGEILLRSLGFPPENVAVLLDGQATKAAIMKQFLAFESLSPDDRLLVFFAGHGTTVTGQRGPVGYLVPADGHPDDKSTLIRWDELTRNSEIIPAKHILFAMDACYSGLAMQRSTGLGERRYVSDMLQRFSRQVITAGKANEVVADGGGPTGNNSIFTGHLLEGMEGKAANEGGVLTASYLMDYVYKHVANDSRSSQTPHFGHFDGDGDFILRTPNGEHLPGGPTADFLVKPIIERPELPPETQLVSVRPQFAEKNGYADPESEIFGRNEWSKKLGRYRGRGTHGEEVIKPTSWLSLVVELVSNQPVRVDIAEFAKTFPKQRFQGKNPYERFVMPRSAITTTRSVILFDSDRSLDNRTEYWNRFLRIEKSGAIEYCAFIGLTGVYAPERLAAGTNVINYVQTIGEVWKFLHATKLILDHAGYQAGIRFLVNLVGTKDSMLIQFASEPGVDKKAWAQPFEWETGDASQNWKCRDANIQVPFQLVLGSLGEAEAKKLIVECAEQLGLAYNHQTEPRCFIFGTSEFP